MYRKFIRHHKNKYHNFYPPFTPQEHNSTSDTIFSTSIYFKLKEIYIKQGSERDIENMPDIIFIQIVTSEIFMVNIIPIGRLTALWEIVNPTVYYHISYL